MCAYKTEPQTGLKLQRLEARTPHQATATFGNTIGPGEADHTRFLVGSDQRTCHRIGNVIMRTARVIDCCPSPA